MAATKKDDTLNVSTMLEKIRTADQNQVEAQLAIASILHSIKTNKLYKVAGSYNSFPALIRAELDFSPYIAGRYVSLFDSFTRWNYTKDEFTKMMRQFGWKRVQEALSTSDRKLGARAMKQWNVQRDNVSNTKQFNLYFEDSASAAQLQKILVQFGLQTTQQGRRLGISAALKAMLSDYQRLAAAERRALRSQRKKNKLRLAS